jgi:hypothetical protein
MKKKYLLMTAIAIFGLATTTFAQVPSYVPTNGLVGWWPFNGNANDQSGNGNNGTVNGATLTTDRFGSASQAYIFDGINDYIIANSNNIPTNTAISISVWINPYQNNGIAEYICLGSPSNTAWGTLAGTNWNGSPYQTMNYGRGCSGTGTSNVAISPFLNVWQNITYVSSGVGGICQVYVNGTFIGQSNNGTTGGCSNSNLYFGVDIFGPNYINCKLDDIGIWNRALTQQEITNLYNAVSCANNLTVTPSNNQLQTGASANFNATTSDPSPSFVWQSDFGQGFQTLNNFGNYSGVNTASLNIANVQLSEHNQPIRVISTSGNCIDTSNVAVINILDTCITNVTVYDTLLTTVTDTLIINATITGINPPNNLNTLKVFPNPASTHITIDYGNFNAMSGYTLKIVNAVGQTVFTTPINQQTSYINLSTWTGSGIYYVQLINPQNNTIENRKIVIQ